VGLFDRMKPSKPARQDPADRWKRAGAREYEARRLEREAERLEALGQATEAEALREQVRELRQHTQPRR